MVQRWFPVRMSIPVVDGTVGGVAVALKKSKMLLLVITLFWFFVLLPAVPTAETHFVGRLAPAGPILLLAMILLLFPTILVPLATVVLNKMFPPAVPGITVDEPRIVQFFTVLFCAPPAVAVVLIKRIVLVP